MAILSEGSATLRVVAWYGFDMALYWCIVHVYTGVVVEGTCTRHVPHPVSATGWSKRTLIYLDLNHSVYVYVVHYVCWCG